MNQSLEADRLRAALQRARREIQQVTTKIDEALREAQAAADGYAAYCRAHPANADHGLHHGEQCGICHSYLCKDASHREREAMGALQCNAVHVPQPGTEPRGRCVLEWGHEAKHQWEIDYKADL